MTTTAEHLRNALDGRWRDVKNQVRTELCGEMFRPHYTPNTVIARTKVGEQLRIMAAQGAAEAAGPTTSTPPDRGLHRPRRWVGVRLPQQPHRLSPSRAGVPCRARGAAAASD